MGGLALVGLVLYVVGWLLTVVLAFRHDEALWGVASLFVPIVWVYYLMSRWRTVWPCIILVLAGGTLFVLGGGLHSLTK
ncbi:MAG: hypothetical protein AB1714_26480 [Acidobacteriota bacterium]